MSLFFHWIDVNDYNHLQPEKIAKSKGFMSLLRKLVENGKLGMSPVYKSGRWNDLLFSSHRHR